MNMEGMNIIRSNIFMMALTRPMVLQGCFSYRKIKTIKALRRRNDLLQNQMPFQKKYRDQGQQDFTVESQPKRTTYKKINKKLRSKLVSLATNGGVPISELSKRYRINYSTISYIIRSHKEHGLAPTSLDLQLKQEIVYESEYEPALATGSGVESEPKIVKVEEAEIVNNIELEEFAETQQFFPFFEMVLPTAFRAGGWMGNPNPFPFYPFANYEGL